MQWKRVPSLPGLLASEDGQLCVDPYRLQMPYGGYRYYGGVPTCGQWDGARYIYPFRGKTYKVARLICEAFRGPAPEDKPNCLHADEDSRNNHIRNLSWGTQKENLNAPGFIAYCKSRTGKNNPYAKGRSK